MSPRSTPEVVKPLTEVAAEIRKELALGEATRILLDAHDSYEDARAGGATLAEAAAKLNLKVVTVDAIDRQALRPDGKIVNDLPESSELLKQAFETEVGIENPAINIGSTGYVFYEVQGITPARDRTLEEVHDKVVADWKIGRSGKAAGRQGERVRQAGSRTARRSIPSPPTSSWRSRPSAASSARPTMPISARRASRRCSASPRAAPA